LSSFFTEIRLFSLHAECAVFTELFANFYDFEVRNDDLSGRYDRKVEKI